MEVKDTEKKALETKGTEKKALEKKALEKKKTERPVNQRKKAPRGDHRRVDPRTKEWTKMEEEKKEPLTIPTEGGEGFIQIADDVVTSIAGLAVAEVDGVARLTGNMPGEIVTKLGMKKLSKGIRFSYEQDSFRIDVSVIVKFGFNIVEVSSAIQEKVKQALQTMTGLTPSVVNVRVAGVDFSS